MCAREYILAQRLYEFNDRVLLFHDSFALPERYPSSSDLMSCCGMPVRFVPVYDVGCVAVPIDLVSKKPTAYTLAAVRQAVSDVADDADAKASTPFAWCGHTVSVF